MRFVETACRECRYDSESGCIRGIYYASCTVDWFPAGCLPVTDEEEEWKG